MPFFSSMQNSNNFLTSCQLLFVEESLFWNTGWFCALYKTCDEFWKKTNIEGMCNARSSNSRFRRVIWMVIFAVFASLTFTGLRDVIKDFGSYPVVTSVTVEHRSQVVYSFYLYFLFTNNGVVDCIM